MVVNTQAYEGDFCEYYSPEYTLRGPQFQYTAAPINFYLPNFNVFSQSLHNPVQQLDLTTIWRGLSSIHAEELSFWEVTFRNCLERRMRPYLEYVESENRGCLGQKITIEINISALIFEMAAMLEPNSGLAWFANNGLLKSVAKFVNTRDCFTASGVEIAAMAGDKVELKWCPPRLVFDDLIVSASEGQSYELRPRIQHPVLLQACQSSVAYSTDCPWLKHNSDTASFSGEVPKNAHQLQIIVTATITHQFGGVLNQQILRAAASLTVCHSEARDLRVKPYPGYTRAMTCHFSKRALRARRPPIYGTVPARMTRLAAAPIESDPISPPQSPPPSVRASSPGPLQSHSDGTSSAGDPEYKNPFAVLANRTDMDNPTREMRAEKMSEGESSLFESVRSKFRADFKERQTSPWRTKLSTDTDFIACHSPVLEDSEAALLEASNANHRALPAAETAKCVRAVQNMSFCREEDPRDVRQMKADILSAELNLLERKMMRRRVGAWISSEDLGPSAMSMESIDEE